MAVVHRRHAESTSLMETFERSGMSFDEFAGVARWNGAEARPIRAGESDIETFREAVEKACVGRMKVRRGVGGRRAGRVDDGAKRPGPDGRGCFSPVAGLAPSSDMVLVLDTARSPYPPHWVPTPLLWVPMADINPWNGKSARASRCFERPPSKKDDETLECPTKVGRCGRRTMPRQKYRGRHARRDLTRAGQRTRPAPKWLMLFSSVDGRVAAGVASAAVAGSAWVVLLQLGVFRQPPNSGFIASSTETISLRIAPKESSSARISRFATY